MRRSIIALLSLFLIATASLAQPPMKEFYQDFRDKRPYKDLFKLIGPNAETSTTQDENGLRFTIAAEQLSRETIGLRSTFGLKGDFEITASFEILHEERPPDGNGMGFMFFVLADSPTGDALGIYRLVKTKGDTFTTMRRATDKDGKRPTFTDNFPAKKKDGRVRLVRTGATLKAYAADGEEEFRELAPYAFVADNIKRIEINAYPGRADRPILPQKKVDVRITDVRVRAESFPFMPPDELRDVPGAPKVAAPAQVQEAPPGESSHGWLIAVGIIFTFSFLLLLLAGVAWFVTRNRFRAS